MQRPHASTTRPAAKHLIDVRLAVADLCLATLSWVANGGASATINLGTSASVTNPQRSGDATTGLFSPAVATVAIAEGGTQKLTVNSTGVGVGSVTSPGQAMDIGGNIQESGDIINTAVGSAIFSASSRSFFTSFNGAGIQNLYTASNGNTAAGSGIGLQFSTWGGALSSVNAIALSSTNSALTFQTSNAGAETEWVRIMNNGNVGIGTTSPAHPIEVQTSASGTWTPVAGFFAPNNTTAGNASQIRFGTSESGNNAAEWRFVYQGAGSTSNRIDFGWDGQASPTFSYIASGNVGIGTTGPNMGLEVVKDNSNGFSALFRNSSSNPGIATVTTGGISGLQGLSANLGAAANISLQAGGGNVGIGTTSPSGDLHVYYDSASTTPAFTVGARAMTSPSGSGTVIGANAASGFAGNLMQLQTNGTNELTLTGAGALSVTGTISVTGHTTFEGVTSTGATGTGNIMYSASPTTTGTLAAAAGTYSSTLSVTGHTTFEGVTSTGATGTGKIMYSISPTTTGTFTAAAVTASGAITLSGVTTGTNTDFVCMKTGNVLTLQTSACTISSRRFKENIEILPDGAINELMALKPVAFNMKPGEKPNPDPNFDKRQLGLIAEDVAKVDKRMAIYEDDGVTPKSYRQEAVISLLVKATQEQQHEIEKQKADTSSLRRQVSVLPVGTTSPQTLVDASRYLRLKTNSSQPATCSAENDGAIALTNTYTLCVCKGGSSSWVQSKDGSSACAW